MRSIDLWQFQNNRKAEPTAKAQELLDLRNPEPRKNPEDRKLQSQETKKQMNEDEQNNVHKPLAGSARPYTGDNPKLSDQEREDFNQMPQNPLKEQQWITTFTQQLNPGETSNFKKSSPGVDIVKPDDTVGNLFQSPL